MTIEEFIGARLSEIERAAMAASSDPGRARVAADPESWRWTCAEDDAPVDVRAVLAAGDPLLTHHGDWRMMLSSTEAYPSVHLRDPIEHIVIVTSDEVSPGVALHLMLNDPYRATQAVTGIRGLLGTVRQLQLAVVLTERAAGLLLGPVAAIWDDHPDYGTWAR